MEQKYIYIGIALAVLIVLLALFWPRQTVVVTPSGAVAYFQGIRLDLSGNVSGPDVECIGAPEGYNKIHYADSSDETEKYYTVAYAKQGDLLESAKSWLEGRASACGYEKYNDESFSVGEVRGVSLGFDLGDDATSIDAEIAVLPASNGKDYTVIVISYSKDLLVSSEEGTESSGSGAEQQTDVPVSGELKEWDDQIRPIIRSVFGNGVVLVQASNVMGSYALDYTVPREVQQSDSEKLMNAFVNDGWVQLSSEQGQSAGSLGFQKGNALLTVEYDFGGDTVSVVIYAGQ